MKFIYDKRNWTNIEEGEKNCYLQANGLGGYSSLSIIGAAARNDQAILMSAKKAPNERWHIISNIIEKVTIDDNDYILTSQRMKNDEDLKGYQYLTKFEYDNYPMWTFKIKDVTIYKKLLMLKEKNTVAVCYKIEQEKQAVCKHLVSLQIKPLLRFTPKNTSFSETQEIKFSDEKIVCGDCCLFEATNGIIQEEYGNIFGPMYFSQDERDGRESFGNAYINHSIYFKNMDKTTENCIIFSTSPCEYHENIFDEMLAEQNKYYKQLQDKAGMCSELGKQLVISADAYIVNRDSTQGKSIIAGYPFFEDWGRDTMISLAGITMVTRRFEECKSILRTFAKYMKNGLLPNLFPEGGLEPMYNSVDAPLLFVNAVYEYIQFSNDNEFLYEIWHVLKRIVEAYQQGTEYHIKMDTDGLIQAGDGLEQLTWMDVRVGDFLPTPRHGKPVEINAYWYNALCIMNVFSKEMAEKGEISEVEKKELYEASEKYLQLAQKVKDSFLDKYWNEEQHCLKDVLNGTKEEYQVRCNQVWALSMPFTMLTCEMEEKVLKKIKDELYTTVGLRTLSMDDKDFHPVYIGKMEERDRAYHQGTVWTFPLGAYYRANVRYMERNTDKDHTQRLKEMETGLEALKEWLKEGCVAQLAEIYDGKTPTISRGCFAQAWSVGELLRAVYDWEKLIL